MGILIHRGVKGKNWSKVAEIVLTADLAVPGPEGSPTPETISLYLVIGFWMYQEIFAVRFKEG
jgi:hypothetical protein